MVGDENRLTCNKEGNMQSIGTRTTATRVLGVMLGVLVWVAAGMAASTEDMGGWETDSPYNRLYDNAERERIKGEVVKVTKVKPMPDMSPAVAVILREGGSSGETIMVHVCPLWFAKPGDIGVKRGDKVKIKGAWAEIDGEDVFMCAKIKKGDYFEFKARLTKDGTPFWTMTPEQLARERSSQ
jgi:hypothetical protein